MTTRVRVVRRRISPTTLLAPSSGDAVSNSPSARELQRRELRGPAGPGTVDGVASSIGSVSRSRRSAAPGERTCAELDRLRSRTSGSRSPDRERPAVRSPARTAGSTRSLRLIARERPSRPFIDRPRHSDGLAVGDVVIAAGGALVGRVPTVVHDCVARRSSSTRRPPSSACQAGARRARSSASSAVRSSWQHRRDGPGASGSRSSPPGSPGQRVPLALSEGPAHRPGRRRPAGRERGRADRVPDPLRTWTCSSTSS